MRKCIRILILIIPLACIFIISKAYAAQSYRINNGANTTINEQGTVKTVTNNSGKDIFVPTNTSAEWSAFLSHLPSGVTATTPTLTIGGTVYNYSAGVRVVSSTPGSFAVSVSTPMTIKVYASAGGGIGSVGTLLYTAGGGGGGGAGNDTGVSLSFNPDHSYSVKVGTVASYGSGETNLYDSTASTYLFRFAAGASGGDNYGGPGGAVLNGIGTGGGNGGAGNQNGFSNGGAGGGGGGSTSQLNGGNGGGSGAGAGGVTHTNGSPGAGSGGGGGGAYGGGGGGGGGFNIPGYGYVGGGGGGMAVDNGGYPVVVGEGSQGVVVFEFVSAP